MKLVTIVLMIITVVSKIFGFLRESIMANYYGTEMVASAFSLANQIPAVIFTFITMGISTGFIPTYKKIEEREGYLMADKFTSNLGNVSVVVGFGLLIALEILAGPVTRLFAIKMEPEAFALSVDFFRITILSIVVVCIATVYRGYLYCKDSYIVPQLQGFILNFVIIISIILSGKFKNVYILPIGLCIATMAQYILYIPAVKKLRFKWTKGIDFNDKYMKNMLIMALPVIFGVSITSIGAMIDKSLATMFEGVRGVAMVGYASRVSELVNGIVVVSVATVAYTALSNKFVAKDMKGFKDTVLSSLNSMNILIYPAMVGLIVFAYPIIDLAFNRGTWRPEDTLVVAPTLQFYALGIAAVAFRDIYSKAFYSMGDTKTPTINAVIMLFVDLILSFIAAKFIGIPGLALGTSLGAFFGAGLLMVLLRKKVGKFEDFRPFVIENIKMIVSSLIMGAASYGVYNLLLGMGKSYKLALLLAIMAAGLVYFLLIYILKVQEFRKLLKSFMDKIKKK